VVEWPTQPWVVSDEQLMERPRDFMVWLARISCPVCELETWLDATTEPEQRRHDSFRVRFTRIHDALTECRGHASNVVPMWR